MSSSLLLSSLRQHITVAFQRLTVSFLIEKTQVMREDQLCSLYQHPPIFLHTHTAFPCNYKDSLPSDTVFLFNHFLSISSPSPSLFLLCWCLPHKLFPIAKPFPDSMSLSNCCSGSPFEKKFSVFLTTHLLFISLSVARIAFIVSLMTTDLPNPRHLFQVLASLLYPMFCILSTQWIVVKWMTFST